MKWPFLGSPENTPHTAGGLLRHLTSSPCFSSCGSEEVASILFPMLPFVLSVAQASAWHYRDGKWKQLPTFSAASPSSALIRVTHMASCTHPQWGAADRSNLALNLHVLVKGSLTPAQSSARPTKHNGRTQWFTSQCIPAAAATKMQTREFKQRLGVSALRPLLLETSVRVIPKLLRGSCLSQHSVFHGHKGNYTGRKFKNESMTVRRT